jgi:hypothetical protein
MRNIKVYDSGEDCGHCDRFTIVLLDEPLDSNFAILGVDAFGGRYFSNFSEGKDGPHLGKLISLEELPMRTLLHVISRIESQFEQCGS